MHFCPNIGPGRSSYLDKLRYPIVQSALAPTVSRNLSANFTPSTCREREKYRAISTRVKVGGKNRVGRTGWSGFREPTPSEDSRECLSKYCEPRGRFTLGKSAKLNKFVKS